MCNTNVQMCNTMCNSSVQTRSKKTRVLICNSSVQTHDENVYIHADIHASA